MAVWTIAGVTALTTFTFTPLVRRLMVMRGVIDVPNHRSSHATPVPRGGGLACVLGVLAGSAISTALGTELPTLAILASILLALVGFLDDRFHLPASPRLGVQVLVGGLLGSTIGGLSWIVIGSILVPLVVNVVNFMDGIDGITAVTLFTWGSASAIAGVGSGVPGLAILGAVTAGAALGFLPWNVPRARIFLGDVGSYLFGGLASSGILLGAAADVPPALVIAPLVIYVSDVLITLGRRALRGKPLMQAHRDHVYQRLVHESLLPHIAVAVGIALISLFMVLAWSTDVTWIVVASTVLALGLYQASVRFATFARSRARSTRNH